jgi:outer membrane lipoprotein-sorting protein
MRYLRTISTPRLLATLATAVIAVGGGTAIAVAASSGGPVPKADSLANAIHAGLSGPQVTGFSADIDFTNHLIAASNLQGSDPLLSGASGRIWIDPAHSRLRLELQSDNGDAEILVDQNRFSISDPRLNTVYEGTLPASKPDANQGAGKDQHAVPSVTEIQNQVAKLLGHLTLNGAAAGTPEAVPGDVGGQPTYSVRITPKHDGGLIGAAQIAWDAVRGIPLDLAVYAANNPSPVLELKASNVDYGQVPASVFAITPPAGEKVVRISSALDARAAKVRGHVRQRDHVTGLRAVARSLPFTLTAPATLGGLPRQSVAKLDFGGEPAALVTYGQGIGGVAVIERASGGGSSGGPASGGPSDQGGLSLPSVSIAGSTGHELDTALGTALFFDRGGVSYTVIGSVPPAAAQAAANDLASAP